MWKAGFGLGLDGLEPGEEQQLWGKVPGHDPEAFQGPRLKTERSIRKYREMDQEPQGFLAKWNPFYTSSSVGHTSSHWHHSWETIRSLVTSAASPPHPQPTFGLCPLHLHHPVHLSLLILFSATYKISLTGLTCQVCWVFIEWMGVEMGHKHA